MGLTAEQARDRSGEKHLALRIVTAAVVLLMAACNSGGDAMPVADTASFTGSGTASSPDTVRLIGVGAGDLVNLDVVISGVTSSNDLYSFTFDLVLGDASVTEYVSGSAEFGSALTLAAGQTSAALVSQTGGRITVGVSKLGGGAGNGVGASEETIVSLHLRVLRQDMTTISIEGSPPNDPAVLDSTGAAIASVQFDSAAAVISGL